MEDRPTRPCDVCGQEDTDPRHVHGLDDGGTQIRHMDCCRTEGCPTGACDEVLEDAEDRHGAELVEYLDDVVETLNSRSS